MNLFNKISGKKYFIFLILFLLISVILKNTIISTNFGFSLLFYSLINILLIVLFYFITFKRWNILKMGKKQFVFYVIISVLSTLYPKPIVYDVGQAFINGDSYFKLINTVLWPFYKLIIIIYDLILIFKNAKANA